MMTPRACADEGIRPRPTDPSRSTIVLALGIALLFVFATRFPVARISAVESDEVGFLKQIAAHWFPMHHTLFLTSGRFLGGLVGDTYRGFILLDMITSALALVSVWWWLRALVRPVTATAGALVLGVAPVFWGYGAMAGNYTAIVAVGAFLLGVAYRTRRVPAAWHPLASAIVLAIGNGYRQDTGIFWLPVFLLILWQHRWRPAVIAAVVFSVINLAWLLAMLCDVHGWFRYSAASSEFAYESGVLNSVWHLGFVDAPLRYTVKLGMALLWTLGPCLVFVPRGVLRLKRLEDGNDLALLLALSIIPALGTHLLLHFGVAGYAFHYLPALLALIVLGIGKEVQVGQVEAQVKTGLLLQIDNQAPGRLMLAATLMAGLFLFYPTNYDRTGWRGDLDLSFAKHTRIGLGTRTPNRQPAIWRTANSRVLAGDDVSNWRAGLPSL